MIVVSLIDGVVSHHIGYKQDIDKGENFLWCNYKVEIETTKSCEQIILF